MVRLHHPWPCLLELVLGRQTAARCCHQLRHLDQGRHFQQAVRESLVIIVEGLAYCQEEWWLIAAGSTVVVHRTVATT